MKTGFIMMKMTDSKPLVLIIAGLFLITACGNRDRGNKAESDLVEYNWSSIKEYPVPAWFNDAKFGIFIHWGVYSVPGWASSGYAEHYPRRLYQEENFRTYHEKTYGKLPGFGYKDFVPLFRAENWDPDAWAELFERAGARYVIPVAEHHDGFAMWDSDLTTWDAMDRGPHRDIIGDLAGAVRKKNLHFAVSYHRERHFEFFDSTGVAPEIERDPECAGLYGPFSLSREFINGYTARWKELQSKYQPEFMWLDHIPVFYNDSLNPLVKEYKQAVMMMIADFLNTADTAWNREVYFNNKGKESVGINFPIGAGIREADNLIMNSTDQKWENPATIAHSYGYNVLDDLNKSYKSTNYLVDLLVDVVSKNGNLLLNIGPKSDGTIPEGQVQRLLEMGDWLRINGEAIYGTRPWLVYGEGPNLDNISSKDAVSYSAEDIRFTQKGETLYAILLSWPDSGKIIIRSLKGRDVEEVRLLGSGSLPEFSVKPEGCEVLLPSERPCDYAYSLAIKLKS